MDHAVQTVFILLNLLTFAMCIAAIGRTGEGRKHSTIAFSGFTHGLFTLAFLIWWDTPDNFALYGKIAAIGLLWLPWLIDLTQIGKPWQQVTVQTAAIACTITAARIGVVLGFWTLY